MSTRLRIITFDELPNWMKDNDLVITGYRAPTPSFWICTKTLFSLHNETLSIWSHLLASIYFFSLYASDLKYRHCRTLVNDDLFLKLYYLTATIAFICSAIYHLFCCYSHYVRDILVKVDYIGITIFITGSFMTWLYYAFHGETSQNCVYLYAVCFGGLLVGILTQLEHFNARESRGHRAGIYVIFGLSLTIPAILLFQKSCKSRQTTKLISSVIYTIIIYLTGGFIYTTRLTERLWPGKVDIIGHSHQIFHVIVVIASIVHEKMIIFIATTNEEMIDTKKWLL